MISLFESYRENSTENFVQNRIVFTSFISALTRSPALIPKALSYIETIQLFAPDMRIDWAVTSVVSALGVLADTHTLFLRSMFLLSIRSVFVFVFVFFFFFFCSIP